MHKSIWSCVNILICLGSSSFHLYNISNFTSELHRICLSCDPVVASVRMIVTPRLHYRHNRFHSADRHKPYHCSSQFNQSHTSISGNLYWSEHHSGTAFILAVLYTPKTSNEQNYKNFFSFFDNTNKLNQNKTVIILLRNYLNIITWFFSCKRTVIYLLPNF